LVAIRNRQGEPTLTPDDYFTNAVRMFLADGGTPESAHRLIDETATKPARAKPSREKVEGAPLSPATSEEIARAIREAFAGGR
jgi:CO/xanthine dehydrogenase FAD-binding subunit